MAEAGVELVAVTKRYGDAVAVDDVSLRIPGRHLLLPARAVAAAARPRPCA